MKKISIMVFILLAICAHAQQNKKSNFVFGNGVNLEPQFKSEEFVCPILLHSSFSYDEKIKLTLFGGYVFSKEDESPLIVAELGYEFENNFEPYLKGEKVFLTKEESINYYAVGLAYNIKINKKIIFIPFAEYGKEDHEKLYVVGVNFAYNIWSYWNLTKNYLQYLLWVFLFFFIICIAFL